MFPPVPRVLSSQNWNRLLDASAVRAARAEDAVVLRRLQTIGSVRTALARIEHSIQNADAAPTTAQVEAWKETEKPLNDLLKQWEAVKQRT